MEIIEKIKKKKKKKNINFTPPDFSAFSSKSRYKWEMSNKIGKKNEKRLKKSIFCSRLFLKICKAKKKRKPKEFLFIFLCLKQLKRTFLNFVC
jgi:hypothetical protein